MNATTTSNRNDRETAMELERAKDRCVSLRDRIAGALPPSKISDSCRRTLLRLVNAEIRFLSRLSPSHLSSPISLNIGYLESIVHILKHPSVTGTSRVCKPISPPSPQPSSSSSSKAVHVDIVCTLGRRPVWFVVSDRNPKYISWLGSHRSHSGLRARVERVISTARSGLSLKPESVIFFFSRGLGHTLSQKLVDEFGASEFNGDLLVPETGVFEELEEGWVNVVGGRARAFEINIGVDCSVRDQIVGSAERECVQNEEGLSSRNEFLSLISLLRLSSGDLWNEEVINFDTTALIALVSGISNGGIDRLLKEGEDEMRKRFKSNYEFVMAQVMSELQNPILVELRDFIAGKKGIICESVCSEFKELVSMCGGINEKARAVQLLKSLTIMPDSPSERIIGLPTTRKIALKNKIVFGTGDYWHAPTLTANMGFVRAISQTGVSLLTIEHRPRALTGD